MKDYKKLEEKINGEKEITIDRNEKCETCNGRGYNKKNTINV